MASHFKPAGENSCNGSNLLATLEPSDRELLRPAMKAGRLAKGHTLYEPGSLVEYCYFPSDRAVVSHFVVLDTGRAIETTMVGREGAIGGIVSHGHLPAFARACVMHEGIFYRIGLAELERAKEQAPAIGQLFARYADCLLAQIFQSVACNASHTIEQRTAKWLLASAERTGSTEVTLTQEQLASMLGVGRSYASRVIQRLKSCGVARTRRGRIEISDLAGMQERACNCNDLVRQHFDSVLEGVYPHMLRTGERQAAASRS